MYLSGFSCKPVNQNYHWSVKKLDFWPYARIFDKDEIFFTQIYFLYFNRKEVYHTFCCSWRLRYIIGVKTQYKFFPMFFLSILSIHNLYINKLAILFIYFLTGCDYSHVVVWDVYDCSLCAGEGQRRTVFVSQALRRTPVFKVMSALYNFSASGCSNKFLSTKEARTTTYVFTLLLKENFKRSSLQ
jgi:hypothetical protein